MEGFDQRERLAGRGGRQIGRLCGILPAVFKLRPPQPHLFFSFSPLASVISLNGTALLKSL